MRERNTSLQKAAEWNLTRYYKVEQIKADRFHETSNKHEFRNAEDILVQKA